LPSHPPTQDGTRAHNPGVAYCSRYRARGGMHGGLLINPLGEALRTVTQWLWWIRYSRCHLPACGPAIAGGPGQKPRQHSASGCKEDRGGRSCTTHTQCPSVGAFAGNSTQTRPSTLHEAAPKRELHDSNPQGSELCPAPFSQSVSVVSSFRNLSDGKRIFWKMTIGFSLL